MKDKIYIVVSEWQYTDGNFDSDVIGVFHDLQQATSCFLKERDRILYESYDTFFKDCENTKDIFVKYDDNYFFVTECFENRWNLITIYEKEVEQRDFITIQFVYDGETFNERIYLDQIDRTYCEDHWVWWFGSHEGSKHPDLNFEVFGDKDDDGNIIYDAFEINIYENEDAMDSIATTCDFEFTTSWLGKKDGFIKYDDYAQCEDLFRS